MKKPDLNKIKNIITEKIVKPLHNHKFNLNQIGNNIRDFTDWVYQHSEETAIVLIVLNFVSMLSSHCAQISGLKKSDRENKDYLIKQELMELLLDTGLTTVPPIIIEQNLDKALNSGRIRTPSEVKTLRDKIALQLGVGQNEIFSQVPKKSYKEIIGSTLFEKIEQLQSLEKIPEPIKKAAKKMQGMKYIEKFVPQDTIQSNTLKDITIDFDVKFPDSEAISKMYKNSAYKEICGQINGILILATLGYTLLTSCVVIPILKNKMANYFQKKELEKKGITKESLKRKKQLDVVSTYSNETQETPDIFLNMNNNIFSSKPAPAAIQRHNESKTETFDNFHDFNKILSKSTGLKI